jgi:hypothetical protein
MIVIDHPGAVLPIHAIPDVSTLFDKVVNQLVTGLDWIGLASVLIQVRFHLRIPVISIPSKVRVGIVF